MCEASSIGFISQREIFQKHYSKAPSFYERDEGLPDQASKRVHRKGDSRGQAIRPSSNAQPGDANSTDASFEIPYARIPDDA